MNSDPNTSTNPRHPLRCTIQPDRKAHGMAKVGGGFPHSEIRGSKPVRGSPRLIAAYHVLHRLSAPRHPPDTLLTLDPLPSSMLNRLASRRAGTDARPPPSRLIVGEAGKTFASEPVRGDGRSSSSSPAGTRPASRDAGRLSIVGPSGSAAPPRCRGPRGRTFRSDTFTLHDVEQHAQPQAERRAGRHTAGGEFWRADGLGAPRRLEAVPIKPSPIPPRDAMVEQDGIEPTTSCLQSTRSPN